MNPFLIKNYHSPYYFCDRDEETKQLIHQIKNQYNIAFFAQRRVGKTALIKHLFHHLEKKKYTCIYIDIYATQNLNDLTNQLANSIYVALQQRKSVAKKYWESIKLLRPILKINEFSGVPELSLDVSQHQNTEKTIPQLLQFLDNLKLKVVIAIDEFQQILTYPEKNVEAILRTVIQQLKNTQFVFTGSDQSMMHEIFNNAKRPFYASVKNLNLKRIPLNIYGDYIKRQFNNNKYTIAKDAIDSILHFTDAHTYYTQILCHDIYAQRVKKITNALVIETINGILKENEGVYYQYRNLLTKTQWKLLIAVSKQEKVFMPYGKEFINTHQLGTPASVRRSLESLVTKDLVYHNSSVEKSYFETQDKFLLLWIKDKYS
ncbi:MAG: ATP-binding protein [Flavobacteriaceae bacterium]